MLYNPVNNFSVMPEYVPVFLGSTCLKCLAQRNKAVSLMSPELVILQSQVQHSTTEPLHSYILLKCKCSHLVLNMLETTQVSVFVICLNVLEASWA